MNTKIFFKRVCTFKSFIYLLFSLFLYCHTIQSNHYGRGETFQILAYPEGIGTMLYFYSETNPSDETTRFEIAMVSKNYGKKLRTIFIDAEKKSNLLIRHRIQQIPTLILFDNAGTEIYRWFQPDLIEDFSKQEMIRIIEQYL